MTTKNFSHHHILTHTRSVVQSNGSECGWCRDCREAIERPTIDGVPSAGNFLRYTTADERAELALAESAAHALNVAATSPRASRESSTVAPDGFVHEVSNSADTGGHMSIIDAAEMGRRISRVACWLHALGVMPNYLGIGFGYMWAEDESSTAATPNLVQVQLKPADWHCASHPSLQWRHDCVTDANTYASGWLDGTPVQFYCGTEGLGKVDAL